MRLVLFQRRLLREPLFRVERRHAMRGKVRHARHRFVLRGLGRPAGRQGEPECARPRRRRLLGHRRPRMWRPRLSRLLRTRRWLPKLDHLPHHERSLGQRPDAALSTTPPPATTSTFGLRVLLSGDGMPRQQRRRQQQVRLLPLPKRQSTLLLHPRRGCLLHLADRLVDRLLWGLVAMVHAARRSATASRLLRYVRICVRRRLRRRRPRV